MLETSKHAIIYSNLGIFEAPSPELNIYPYQSLNWSNYVERFKFKVPEPIATKADGRSVCSSCKQLYIGYQDKCTRLRYGYETSSYHKSIKIGNALVGEEMGGYLGKVTNSGLYPCNHSCTWDKSAEFYKQTQSFGELERVIGKLASSYKSADLELNDNDAEKYALTERIEMLRMENEQIRYALKEVVNRLNTGGQGLMGHINF